MSKINPIGWSTQKIKDLLVQIDHTGTIPRYNPFFNNDSTLLAADIKFGLTKEEALDRTRVSEDIFYFATTHAKVKTDEGEIKNIRNLRNYQKNMLHHFKEHKFNIVLASRQIGKCVHPFTKIDAEFDGKREVMPIFEAFYQTMTKLTFFDHVIYGLLRASYALRN